MRQHRGIEQGLFGIGYEKNAITVKEVKETLQACKIRAYQSFVEDRPCICVKLNNRIYSSEAFADVEADYYIYDFSQLVAEYHQYSNMLEHLEQIVMSIGENQNTKEYANASFLKLLSWIQENYKNDISLTQAAEEMHMNPNYVSRMFKKYSNKTPSQYREE